MGTFTAISFTAGKLVAAGFCLGLGFWMSKQFTNVADEYIALYRERSPHNLDKMQTPTQEATAIH